MAGHGGVDAMVIVRGEIDCDVFSPLILLGSHRIVQQIRNRIIEPFGLDQTPFRDGAKLPDRAIDRDKSNCWAVESMGANP